VGVPPERPAEVPDRLAGMVAGARTHLPVALLVVVPLVWLASAEGGYFPQQWGWPAVGLLLVVAVTVLVRDDLVLGRLEQVALVALAAYAGWVALSTAWSPSAAQPVQEAERTILYVAALVAVLLLSSRRSPDVIAAGLLAAITGICAYALATRLFPGEIGTYPPSEGYQLSAPIGYWNGLGIMATIGILLAVGIAAHARRHDVRVAAALAVLVLGPTLYFTFSRGALLALGIGGAAMALIDPRRGRLGAVALAVVAAPAVAVWVASRSDGLTRAGSPLEEATHDGHRLALLLVPLAVLSTVIVLSLAIVERRLAIGRSLRRGIAVGLLVVALAGLGAIVARSGDPVDLLHKEVDAFAGPLRSDKNLNGRLLNVSGNGRMDYWHAAWAAYADHPWLGVGAAGYEREWLARRPTAFYARDAHNLYLETLAELGPLGLILLVTALGVPLVAAVRARRRRAVPAAAGAYVAFLAHAALDWDWEIPAVALSGLLCAAALLVAARSEAARQLSRPLRLGTVALLVALIAFSFVGQVGNNAAERSFEATAQDDYGRAAQDARTARRWAPWSFEGWQRLGEAQLAAGDLAAARTSFRSAIDRDPEDWGLWYELATASKGQEQERALTHAERLNPRSPEVAELKAELAGR
jgi:O-antigen ligase